MITLSKVYTIQISYKKNAITSYNDYDKAILFNKYTQIILIFFFLFFYIKSLRHYIDTWVAKKTRRKYQ
jgi:hypothetical protein